MWGQIWTGLRINILLTILAGVFYPFAITGICQLVFPHQANGSLILRGDRVIGSELIGQRFNRPGYFHPRPSVAGIDGYNASSSGGSNLGPTSARLILGTIKRDGGKNEVVDFDGISLRIVRYCLENGIPYQASVPLDRFRNTEGALDEAKLIKAFNDDKAPLQFVALKPVPADAVTASGSGLDPNISPANATIQAARIARIRGIPLTRIHQLIAQETEGPALGIFGEARVNVLQLNLALDHIAPGIQ